MCISMHSVQFRYSSSNAIKSASLEIPEKKFTVILGKNGSGKTTLIKLMTGLLTPQEGEVRIFGKNLSKLAIREKARLVGYLPQGHSPIFPFLVEEFVLTGRAPYVFSTPGKKDIAIATGALEKLGILHLSKRPYTDLSSGELQLVMIARILAQQTPVVLLDEPVSHLDITNTERCLKIIKRLVSEGLTVAAILHDVNLALRYADHIILLKDGTVLNSSPLPIPLTLLAHTFDLSFKKIRQKNISVYLPR